ncbi:MAG: hypothetical protein HY985_08690 [Magnetospirillum sp.]|nr:hypothetical protein [Magnetospirillum sp.]
MPGMGRRADARIAILAFGASLLALLWGAVLHQGLRARAVAAAGFHLELTNYSRLLEAHTRMVIRGLDQVVMHLKAEYEDNPKAFDLKAQIARSPILKGLSVQVGLIDAEGYLGASTSAVPTGQRVYLGDREHFTVHARSDDGALFISKPVLGRASGKWSIQLARRLNDKSGAFAGVVVVSLDPGYISDVYEHLDLGPGSTILVLGRDGIARARAAGQDRMVGQDFSAAPFFAGLWDKPEGDVHGASPIDGSLRVGVFRRLSDYPLTVVVTRTAADLGAASAHEEGVILGAGFFGTLLILAGTLVLHRQAGQQAAATRLLRAREAELRQKNRDLEQFTDVLAHHLQEPVRLQYAFAQRLEKLAATDLSDPAKGALDYVLKGALRLRALLRDVQLYLALDQIMPPDHPSSAERALSAALDHLRERIDESGAVIERQPLPVVAMDEKHLSEVFFALIDNAIVHRPPGCVPRVRIAAERQGPDAVFTVEDDGPGISPEFHDRVFRVFERLNPNPSRVGTGIGLALVKKIVETAGGRVWIEGGDGSGSRVRFAIAAASKEA